MFCLAAVLVNGLIESALASPKLSAKPRITVKRAAFEIRGIADTRIANAATKNLSGQLNHKLTSQHPHQLTYTLLKMENERGELVDLYGHPSIHQFHP